MRAGFRSSDTTVEYLGGQGSPGTNEPVRGATADGTFEWKIREKKRKLKIKRDAT